MRTGVICPKGIICQLCNRNRTVQWGSSAQVAAPFACSFNIFYIYQAFILLFHKALHPPSPFSPFLSICLSCLAVVSRPVVLSSGLSLRFIGDVYVFFLQSSSLQLETHYPVNPSSDHFHTDAVVPSSDHCYTQAVLPPSGHYGIETVTPSADHYCIDTVVPSSDHCCTETGSPSSDHYKIQDLCQ